MPDAGGDAGGPSSAHAGGAGLVAALRVATAELHREAERTGIVSDLLTGRAGRAGYALYLRNLVPVYAGLERALETCGVSHAASRLYQPELVRAPALEADLRSLDGEDWRERLPWLDASRSYVERLAAASVEQPALLAAHAYVRYLGDLSGGQILSRLLSRSLGLGASEVSFFRFSGIDDIAAYKARYLALIEAAVATDEAASVVAEAQLAFRLNIALSQAVATAAR